MITGPNLSLPAKELERRFKRVLPRLPVLAGNEGINFILDNFKKQGFQGAAFIPWKKRKDPTKWGTRPKNNGRSLLVMSGRLRRSWRIISTGNLSVTIGSDDPKAKAHNEGLRIGQIQSVKAFTRNRYSTEKKGTGTYSIKTRKENTRTVKSISGTINVSAHKRRVNVNLPKRQMIGQSPYLTARIKRKLSAEIMKELKLK